MKFDSGWSGAIVPNRREESENLDSSRVLGKVQGQIDANGQDMQLNETDSAKTKYKYQVVTIEVNIGLLFMDNFAKNAWIEWLP
jgi:hypothetical protein